MITVTTGNELRRLRREWQAQGKSVGLVPTMGALHEGHLSLVRAAKAGCDRVVVSIFVNPTQFGPQEDLSRYPRRLAEDCRMLEAEGVDAVFAPEVEEMYPAGASTFVIVEEVGDRLDGASRPGHFRGVATIVSKLFHMAAPERAYFGQKDAAQVAVLRRMVRDLNFDVELAVCPIVREPDGLALSSRNVYLSAEERQQALVLSRALQAVEKAAASGEVRSVKLMDAARAVLAGEPGVRLDYLAVVDPDTLEDVAGVERGALVALAAFAGQTRLIDNLLLAPRTDV